jgi:cytochrome c oxidase subunit 3
MALGPMEQRGVSAASALSKRKTSYVGMILALASWAMLFASLFFAYAVLRLSAPTWPPEGAAALPRLLPSINTLVIVLSSLVLWNGRRLSSESKPGALRRALVATMALGGLFLALQLAVWIPLWRQGFRIDSGIYGSIFYGLTTFHALHVVAGLIALACLLPGARRGVYVSSRQSPVRLTAMFWDFVGIVWVVLFVAVYFL